MNNRSRPAFSPADHAKAAREKARAMARSRKEEFIGARVPVELRNKVFARAQAEGVPASLLIRRILEDAFRDQVGDSTTESRKPTTDQVSLATNTSVAQFPDVLGWENIILHKGARCSGCGSALAASASAALGFSGSGGPPVVLCARCRSTM